MHASLLLRRTWPLLGILLAVIGPAAVSAGDWGGFRDPMAKRGVTGGVKNVDTAVIGGLRTYVRF